jgi:hypothetical protein
MADLRVTTMSGPDTVLKEADVAAFKQSLRGPLIAPGDDSYAMQRPARCGTAISTGGLA